MYNDTQQNVQRPVLRIIPRVPRPWRVAWKEAVERVQQERAA
jgi:hypothetical protein